jgi:hypothetical protein
MRLAEPAQAPHLFTVAEYMKLDIPGRTELLGGAIYDVSPKNTPRGFAIRRLIKAFRALGDEYSLSVQDPIAVAGWTGKHAPEIDVAVIDEKPYLTTPTASDSHAFIEVSDTTYADDKATKIPLYVAAKVPTWHVNIPAQQVEFYAVGAEIASPQVFLAGETVEILGIPIPVASLWR